MQIRRKIIEENGGKMKEENIKDKDKKDILKGERFIVDIKERE